MGVKIKTKVYLVMACLPAFLAVLLVLLTSTTTPVMAASGINPQLSFEGKLVKADGTNITNGTYNMEFKVYQDGTNTGSGSTLKWTEDRLVGGTGGVTLTDGTFQVNLGSVNPFGGSVDWNQDTLWLSLQIGNSSSCTISTTFQTNCSGDGEMSPYIRLTAVPQAMVAQSANTLGGTLTAGNFVQLAQGLQTDTSITNASIAINKNNSSGTPNILQLQKASSNVFVVDNSGRITLQPAAGLTSGQISVAQTVTNASSSGGTVDAFNQVVSIANTGSASTTNGFDISITDNSSVANIANGINIAITDAASSATASNNGLIISIADNGNTRSSSSTGISVALSGSNSVQSQVGIDSGVTNGVATRGVSTGLSNSSTCGPTTSSFSIGVCGVSTATTAGNNVFGGYFASTGSGGAALFATNGASTSSILRLQDGNNTSFDVFKVADGGATSLHNQTDSVAALQVQNFSGTQLLNADTSNMRLGVDVTYTAMSTPTGFSAAAPSNGGSLTLNTAYYYKVTAIDSTGGETAATAEACQMIAAFTSNKQIALSWTAVPLASGYRIYRSNGSPGVACGTSNTEVYLKTVLTNAYTDTGSVAVGTIAAPSSNTAYVSANSTSSSLQLTIGGLGSPVGQVYISGMLPKELTSGGVSLASSGNRVSVQGHYAYVAAQPFSGTGKLQVFDITSPAAPVDVSSGGVTITGGSGPGYVKVQGHYAYTVTYGGKLQVFDITKAYAPVDMTGGGITVPGGLQDFAVQGRYAYISTVNSLEVIDLSNPASPKDIGRAVISALQNIFIRGSYIYATSSSGKLFVIDISNPSKPTDVSSGGVTANGNAAGVYVVDRYAYLVGGTKLQVFDVSNPTLPVDVSNTGVALTAAANTVYVNSRFAYVLESTKLQVFDVSNPTLPVDVSGGGVSISSASNMDIQGRYAYVVGVSTQKLQTFDLGGTYTQQLEAGGAEFGTLQVDSNGQVAGDFNVQGGLSVGQGIQTAGNVGVSGALYVQGAAVIGGGKNSLGAPSSLVATPTTGGSLPAGAYKYYVTAYDAYGGETTVSNEATATATVGNPTIGLTWTAAGAGTSGYKVYRTAVGGLTGTEKLLISVITNSYNDTNAVGLGINAIPTIDTTGQLIVSGSALFQSTTNSATAFQVQNSTGTSLLTVDTLNSKILWGANTIQRVASGTTTIDLNDGSATTLAITNSGAGAVASISASGDIAAGSGRVFKVGATSGSTISACGSTQFVSSFASAGGLVTAGSCTNAVTNLSNAYNTAASTGNTIGLTTAGAGVLIQDNSSPIGGNLFAVQKNTGSVTYLGVTATGINIQSNFTGSAVNALAFDTSTAQPHLKVFGANGTNYADIYYDSATSTAYYGANTGTAVLGSGTGAVNVTAGAGAAFVITGNAASSISTTASSLTLDAAGGTIILGSNTTTLQKSGTALTLDVNSASPSTLTVTNAGAGTASLSVEGAVTAGGNITAGSSGTYTTSGGTATYTSAGASTFSSAAGSSLTLDSGTTGAINVGNSANAKAIAIGNSQTTTTVAITTGNVTATHDNNGFRVASSNGTYSPNLLNVDNTKVNANNLVANPSFEGAISNWSAVGTGAASQTSAQVYEGTKSLLIASGTTEGGASYSTGATTFLSTNTTYTLSAYIRTDSTTPIHIDMGDEEATGTLIPCLANQLLPQNSGWQRFTCTWTTSAVSPTNSFIYFKQTSTDPAVTKNIYVDDVLLQTDTNSDTNYRNGAITLTGTIINSPVVLQNAGNTSNALQVQNSSGNTIFNIDTTDSNLIANPGYETNATGWSALASTTTRRDSTKSYLGNYSLQIAIAGATTGGTQFSLNPVVTTTTALGGNYTVSFFALLGSGTAPTYQVTYSPDGAATSTCSPAGTIVTTGWMRLSCSGLTSATTPTTSGFIKIAQTNTAISTWYLDGVQLENAAAASAYGAGAVSLNGVITSPVVFKGNSNSTTAFQIQNTSSVNMLGVDTVNNVIQIGSSTSDATAVFIVLDSYNTAADPTAPSNGAMYYNTSTNVFRCRENGVWKNCIDPPANASVGDQSPTAATNTYLTGSNIAIPQSGVRAGSQIMWRMSVSKTAAGTAAPTFAVVFGTAGTIADTARASFTLPAETAAADTAQITIICTVRTVSATGTISCNLQLVHNAANAVGFVGTATSGSVALTTTSATFDDTVANSIIGLTVNSNTANAFTFQQVQASTVNL